MKMKIKRKVNDREYIHKLLDLKTNAQLKQICRDYKIRGFSKYGKSGLVDFVHNSLKKEQLERVFEISKILIFNKSINSDFDWNLKKIYEIIKNLEPDHIPYDYGRPVDIEKKDFKQIEVTGGIKEKRLDFTISLASKLMQPVIRYINDITIKTDYIFTLRKIDFISVQEETQEGIIFHQIFQINFGDFPDSSLRTVKDWLILAGVNYDDGNFYMAIQLYEMLLRDFELENNIREKILKNIEKTKKAKNIV